MGVEAENRQGLRGYLLSCSSHRGLAHFGSPGVLFPPSRSGHCPPRHMDPGNDYPRVINGEAVRCTQAWKVSIATARKLPADGIF